jgi:hypothetical protein
MVDVMIHYQVSQLGVHIPVNIFITSIFAQVIFLDIKFSS